MDRLAQLEHAVLAMAADIDRADPSGVVVACPGWTVRDLVPHVIGVHDWARAALDRTTPPPYAEPMLADDLAAAYTTSGQSLLARLRELPLDHACWTFDQDNRTASFWVRRQLHEVAVHRFDVSGHEPVSEVATDGIDEVVDVLLPRQMSMGRVELPDGGLRLLSGDRSWTVGRPPYETVTGHAGELFLRLWGRGAPLPDGWHTLTP